MVLSEENREWWTNRVRNPGKVSICPSAPIGGGPNKPTGANAFFGSYCSAWNLSSGDTNPVHTPWAGSYGVNGWLIDGWVDDRSFRNETQMIPARTPLLGDCVIHSVSPIATDLPAFDLVFGLGKVNSSNGLAMCFFQHSSAREQAENGSEGLAAKQTSPWRDQRRIRGRTWRAGKA
jgi:hypothetical protein